MRSSYRYALGSTAGVRQRTGRHVPLKPLPEKNMGKQKVHNNTDPISFTAGTLLPDMSFPGSHQFTLHEFCTDKGKFYGRIKRTLFKESQSTGRPAISFKNEYLKAFGITARQFNAIRIDLQGNIDSAI